MRRIPELTELSREHHQSLRLARHCLQAVEQGDHDRVRALCKEIGETFDETWNRHFNQEEEAIFSVTDKMDGEIQTLGRRLTEEHRKMRALVQRMQQGDCSALRAFGELLRDHTRLEERQLFPLVEAQFSKAQKAHIAEVTGAETA